MKKLLFSVIAIGIGMMANAQKVKPVDSVEKKVNKLIASMTLEEKVGQMTQVTLVVIGTNIDGELDALI